MFAVSRTFFTIFFTKNTNFNVFWKNQKNYNTKNENDLRIELDILSYDEILIKANIEKWQMIIKWQMYFLIKRLHFHWERAKLRGESTVWQNSLDARMRYFSSVPQRSSFGKGTNQYQTVRDTQAASYIAQHQTILMKTQPNKLIA